MEEVGGDQAEQVAVAFVEGDDLSRDEGYSGHPDEEEQGSEQARRDLHVTLLSCPGLRRCFGWRGLTSRAT